MTSMSLAPSMSTARATEGPTAQQWNSHRDEICALYAEMPLMEVRAIMEQRYGFRATDRMYKSRLRVWRVPKGSLEKEYLVCARLHQKRKQNGKTESLFIINGKRRSLRDLRKHIKGRKVSEESFFALAEQNVTDEQLAEQHNTRAVTPPLESLVHISSPRLSVTTGSPFASGDEISDQKFSTFDSGYGTSRATSSTVGSTFGASSAGSRPQRPPLAPPIAQTKSITYQLVRSPWWAGPPWTSVKETTCAGNTLLTCESQLSSEDLLQNPFEHDIEKSDCGEKDVLDGVFCPIVIGENVENVPRPAELKTEAGKSAIAQSEKAEQQETHALGQTPLSPSPTNLAPQADESHRTARHRFIGGRNSPLGADESHEFFLSPSLGPSWDGVDVKASTSDGEASFVGLLEPQMRGDVTPEIPRGLTRRVILQLSWELAQLCPTFPTSGLASHASGSPRADTTGSSSRGHTQSTAATSLDQSGNKKTVSDGQRANEGKNDSDEDSEESQRQGGSNSRARQQTDQEKLLACPYSKHDSNRYSSRNIVEKEYRHCSSSFLKNISRLKQHLYRVHKRPEYHCSRCYSVFDTRDQLDEHSRKAIICRISRPKFTEKMTETQFKAIKRRVIRGDPCALWFSIFRTLFPGSPVPNSPYASCVDAATINHFVAFFLSVGPELMLNLMRDLREQNGELPRLELSTQSIVDEAFEIALPQYLSREHNTMLQNLDTDTTSQPDLRQTWPSTMPQNHESGTMSQHYLNQVWGTQYFGMPDYHGPDPQHDLNQLLETQYFGMPDYYVPDPQLNTSFAGAAMDGCQLPAVSLHGDFTTQPTYDAPWNYLPTNHGYEESQDLQGFVIDPAEVPVAFDAYVFDTS